MVQKQFSISISDDLMIRGTIFCDEGEINKKPVVVICHGFKGFKDWGFFPYAASELSKNGYVVVTFNFSCNGVGDDLFEFTELDKFAVNTFEREIKDLNVVVEAIEDGTLPFANKMDKTKLAIIGHSKGGGDAILFSSLYQKKIQAVVTWNGIANVDLFRDIRKELEENGVAYIHNARTKQQMPIKKVVIDDIDQNKEQYNLLTIVESSDIPYLFIQGTNEFERLVKGAKKLEHHAKDGQLVWIEDGTHTFNTVHPFQGTSLQLEQAINETVLFLQRSFY